MTHDASSLPSAEEWETFIERYPAIILAEMIEAKVRALVREHLAHYHADHVAPCPVDRSVGAPLNDPRCTCGLAALLADEEAPRG